MAVRSPKPPCSSGANWPQSGWRRLDLHLACEEWRLLHRSAVPAIERDDWVARYFEILAAGYATQPRPQSVNPRILREELAQIPE